MVIELFPVQCASCGSAGRSPCERCLAALALDGEGTTRLPSATGPDSVTSLLRYDSRARPFVTGAKYRGAWSSFGVFAPLMAEVLVREFGGALDGAVVTWAPTTPARRRARGYDQAKVLARRVARELGRPCRPLLRRIDGGQQTGRTAVERSHGARFEPMGRCPATVVVVDDVTTTGATMRAAASMLKRAGATSVHGLVLARTPKRS